jgi:hypothetical protein
MIHDCRRFSRSNTPNPERHRRIGWRDSIGPAHRTRRVFFRPSASHRAGHGPVAKQPIYVQLETSSEADAFTGSGHDTLLSWSGPCSITCTCVLLRKLIKTKHSDRTRSKCCHLLYTPLTYLLRIPRGDRIEIYRRILVNRQQQCTSRP